jgi:hypothetical protein
LNKEEKMKKVFMGLVLLIGSIIPSSVCKAVKRDARKSIKIAIVSLYDKSYEPIGKYAHVNKQAYAKKHGYDIFLYTESLDMTRKPHWSKIIALQKHLQDYDWLFWTDADALIMNNEIRLESLIDDNFDIIITKDCYNCVNTGNFFIKNSVWSAEFLKRMYQPVYLNHPGLNDNWAFLRLYADDPTVKTHIKLVNPNLMNSYIECPPEAKAEGLYKQGDFIIHFAGLHLSKAQLMQKWSEKALR